MAQWISRAGLASALRQNVACSSCGRVASPWQRQPDRVPTLLPQVNGAVASGPSLAVEVNGLQLPNPFVIGSGPPGTNYAVSGVGMWHNPTATTGDDLNALRRQCKVHGPKALRLLHSTPLPGAAALPPEQVMKKAFEEGWGAVIAKTVSLDSSKVVNVTPR